MPIIHVELLEGRDDATIARLARQLTIATSEALESPPDRIRVLVSEVAKNRWAVGGTMIDRREGNKDGLGSL